MQIFRGVVDIPADFGPSALTIGKFDGVHIGHVAILRQLVSIAHQKNLTSVVVTFDRHPSTLLHPEEAPANIVSLDDRLALISQQGIDACVVLTFDSELSKLEPSGFVEQVLCERLHTQLVLAGNDFRFGANATGDIHTLTELGTRNNFEVVLLEDVTPSDGIRASSSLIRKAMAQGDIARTRELLGRNPRIHGEVVHGAKRGRELGFPTANLSQDSTGLVPAEGIYAGWFHDAGTVYPCAISVGTNPTFEGVNLRTVEAFLLDQNLDLYGHEVQVEFVAYLRGMVAFEGIEPLIEQMQADVIHTREVLKLEKS